MKKLNELSLTNWKLTGSLGLCVFTFFQIDVFPQETISIVAGILIYAAYDTFIDFAQPPTLNKILLMAVAVSGFMLAYLLAGGTAAELKLSVCIGMGIKALRHGYDYVNMLIPIFSKSDPDS